MTMILAAWIPLPSLGWAVVSACAAVLAGTSLPAAAADPAEKLLVVDCLLPGQVRKLGSVATYITARRAVKTSAEDCEIRGGEYVAYDRGDYSSAMKAWLPAAQQGDKAAQTYVGEILEKGLGTQPDYAAAASWYEKAAAQGFARAQINLGFLYEKGLGVKKDPVAALDLYRKASGLADTIMLDGGAPSPAGQEREIKALRQELEEARRRLEEARRELEQQQDRSRRESENLEQQRRKAVEAGNAAEVRRLEEQLKRRDEELTNNRLAVARLEQQMSGYRIQLEGLQSESAGLRDQLERSRAQLQAAQRELDDRRTQVSDAQKRLELVRAEFDRQRHDVSVAAQAERVLLAARLEQREAEFARQAGELARAESEAQRYRTELASLERAQPAGQAAQPQGFAAAPSIQVIDPPLSVQRSGPMMVTVRGEVGVRDIVGRVTAVAGLMTFTVNDRNEVARVDGDGLFRVSVRLSGANTPVSLVAVDRQGKRSALDFSLVTSGAAPAAAAARIPAMNFGKFHALVIGNEDYQQLPKLKTPVADARAVADVLRKKYAYETTTLLNVTRYQLLSELNKLRAKLTDSDNLLIYYAGHGELDKANSRGHWLPVDAEPSSDANWISTVSITDILNAMAVKHVLVVADSCYSGALTRSSIGQLEAGRSEQDRLKWLAAMTKARTRVALTSGGLQPVIDEGGGGHSVFAKYFLEVLNLNEDVIEARRVYDGLAARVLNGALRYRIEQVPQYAPIQFAGHESGDFLFVRTPN